MTAHVFSTHCKYSKRIHLYLQILELKEKIKEYEEKPPADTHVLQQSIPQDYTEYVCHTERIKSKVKENGFYFRGGKICQNCFCPLLKKIYSKRTVFFSLRADFFLDGIHAGKQMGNRKETFPCTPDREILDLTLGWKFLSYPG